MGSLRARLAAGLALLLLAGFALQWGLVSLALRAVTEDYVESRLARDADVLLAGLRVDRGAVPTLARVPEGRYGEVAYSGQYWQVHAGPHVLRSDSLWDWTLPETALPPGAAVRVRIEGPVKQSLLLVGRGFHKSGLDVAVLVAEDMDTVDAGIRKAQYLLLAVTAGTLVLMLVLLQVTVRRGLAPLETTRIDMERVARGESELLAEDVPTEIAPLVREINTLLALLSRRLARSRTLVGNLAHGLKTPLTLVRQLLRHGSLAALPEPTRRIEAHIDAIAAQVERELNRARLAGDGRGGRRFDPARDVPALATTLAQLHAERAPRIEFPVPPAGAWAADREDMLELLGNLADNACKWCRGRVRITLPAAGSLIVEDDGSGAPDLAASHSHGVRLDESRPGHGLGLSIVRDIVDHYEGAIVFDTSPDLGGLRVRVTLPARG